MCEAEIEKIKSQLKIARNEISNLRSQINNLNHVHRKDVELMKATLQDFRCHGWSISEPMKESNIEPKENDLSIDLKPIGYIKTIFTDKRAVPRQANIAEGIFSRIELLKDVYTNPQQSLETLDEFSHFWIIYYFHRNICHFKPKVSPPRLDGKKVGVFATRSPHRFNPIGMSLVRLDHIEGSVIYFYGSDMVNDTPVIDIKPYIPRYDCPEKFSDNGTLTPEVASMKAREEPEGEDSQDETTTPTSSSSSQQNLADVKVPAWINNHPTLTVIFSENALGQINEFKFNQKTIEDILKNDPRSVYVREKYLSQIYNFQVDGNNVICKFDDVNGTVTVLQVRRM
ncbi:CLUMA_CG009020, isoform B [Clunio marinus]|uniref:CLUMA_CG009020, isoform B n=1 Tax=Clunio marinus TaxID=568069 RepID=A0A1J1I7K5_9DIPT|nr:CLUMA_CG009020, isoform B [Clunio marinus]